MRLDRYFQYFAEFFFFFFGVSIQQNNSYIRYNFDKFDFQRFSISLSVSHGDESSQFTCGAPRISNAITEIDVIATLVCLYMGAVLQLLSLLSCYFYFISLVFLFFCSPLKFSFFFSGFCICRNITANLFKIVGGSNLRERTL